MTRGIFRTDNEARRPLSLAAAALGLMILSGCGDEPRPAMETSDTAQSIVVRDAVGRELHLAAPASRVVSLAPSITEILFSIGAGPQVVGRTSFCNYPPEAQSVPVVSDLSTPNYERIVAIRPDLLLMTFVGNSGSAYERLVQLGLQPFAVSAETIPGTLAAIDTIGLLVGRSVEARTLVTSIRSTIDSIRALVAARPRVSAFIVLDRSPLMTVSGGFVNDALELAGGVNIAEGDPAAYPRFSREEVLRRNPDVIIVPSDVEVEPGSLIASFPEWRNLRAIREGRVRAVPPDIMFRPGPRLGQSIAALHRALHGE